MKLALAVIIWHWLMAQPPWYGDRDEDPAVRGQRLWLVAAAVSEASQGDKERASRILAHEQAETHWASFAASRCHLERIRCDRGKSIGYGQWRERSCPPGWAAPHGSYRQVLAFARCADRRLNVRRSRLPAAYCALGGSGSLCKYGQARASRAAQIVARL